MELEPAIYMDTRIVVRKWILWRFSQILAEGKFWIQMYNLFKLYSYCTRMWAFKLEQVSSTQTLFSVHVNPWVKPHVTRVYISSLTGGSYKLWQREDGQHIDRNTFDFNTPMSEKLRGSVLIFFGPDRKHNCLGIIRSCVTITIYREMKVESVESHTDCNVLGPHYYV